MYSTSFFFRSTPVTVAVNQVARGATCLPATTTSSPERERPATSASIGVKTMWFSLLMTTTSTCTPIAAIEVLSQSHACETATHDDDSEAVGFFSDVGHILLRRDLKRLIDKQGGDTDI